MAARRQRDQKKASAGAQAGRFALPKQSPPPTAARSFLGRAPCALHPLPGGPSWDRFNAEKLYKSKADREELEGMNEMARETILLERHEQRIKVRACGAALAVGSGP